MNIELLTFNSMQWIHENLCPAVIITLDDTFNSMQWILGSSTEQARDNDIPFNSMQWILRLNLMNKSINQPILSTPCNGFHHNLQGCIGAQIAFNSMQWIR